MIGHAAGTTATLRTQVRAWVSTRMAIDLAFWCGAGDRDRTGTTSLEGWSSTIELHPRVRTMVPHGFCFPLAVAQRTRSIQLIWPALVP